MDKTMRHLLTLIKVLLLILAGLFLVRCLVDPGYTKIGGVIAGFVLPFLPDFIERVFKQRPTPHIELAYYVFLFVALSLGISMDFSRTVPYFDKVVHFFSGVFTAVVAYYVLVYYHADSTRRNFRTIFIICFSLAVGVLWEFFEFGCDKLLGQHMQQLISVGVDDTMFDLLSAFVGSIVGGLIFVHPKPIRVIEADPVADDEVTPLKVTKLATKTVKTTAKAAKTTARAVKTTAKTVKTIATAKSAKIVKNR